MNHRQTSLRVDRWLWFARFFKTRGLAARVVSGGHLRINARKIAKPAHKVVPGDTLTFPAGREVRVVRILALGTRRGPASEARTLYEDRTPPRAPGPPSPPQPQPQPQPRHDRRKGRPTKKDRRRLENSRRDLLD